LVVGLAGAIVLAVVPWLTKSDGDGASTAPSGAERPTRQQQGEQVGKKVSVRISVWPADARLYVAGKRQWDIPFHGELDGGQKISIRVEATGYETVNRTLDLDGDHTLEIVLKRGSALPDVSASADPDLAPSAQPSATTAASAEPTAQPAPSATRTPPPPPPNTGPATVRPRPTATSPPKTKSQRPIDSSNPYGP